MMAKRTLWQWLFGLMAQPGPEPRQPMAVRNRPFIDGALIGTLSLTEDELKKVCSGGAKSIAQKPWHPGIEHTQPHPVKENPDGTLYYKGKVYRMIGDHGRRNSNRKRRQAKGTYE